MVLTETHNLQFFRRKIKFCDFCQKNTILETVEENIFFKKKKRFYSFGGNHTICDFCMETIFCSVNEEND